MNKRLPVKSPAMQAAGRLLSFLKENYYKDIGVNVKPLSESDYKLIVEVYEYYGSEPLTIPNFWEGFMVGCTIIGRVEP